MNLQEQIAQMQREIDQWQKDPSGSAAMKRQLQALQSELDTLAKRTRPAARRNRALIQVVKPTRPPQVALTQGERQIWSSFFHFHRALLQYSGWVNRTEWLQLADVAADMTGGNPMLACDFPTQPGIWVWDGTTQLWLRTNGIPFPSGVQGIYGWDAGNQRWVQLGEGPGPGPDGGTGVEEAPSTGVTYGRRNGLWVPVQSSTGVTDGSNATAGQVGEYLSLANLPTPVTFSTSLSYPAADGDFTQLGTLSLSAGDWTVGALIDMWLNAASTVGLTSVYLGQLTTNWSQTDVTPSIAWFLSQANDGQHALSMGPVRINVTGPTQVTLQAHINSNPVVQAGADYALWARRAR